MDGHCFDDLTRALAEGTTRRRVLRGLAGGALAGAAALLERSPVTADGCKGEGKACKKDEQCCSGLVCIPPTGAQATAKSESTCQPPPPTCGGFGQPCCDSAACDAGLTCRPADVIEGTTVCA